MKKRNFKSKLHLSKKIVSNLTKVHGGKVITGGCSDGCSPIHSLWNCSKQNCTADCPPLITLETQPCTDSNAVCC
ncbi:hypothetical protein [uncultured Kordia sp.]|uniref:hypothetical protein n=1 Tax=uncultured Kordia sp. TaxID=507699 RepID=UPI00263317F1|nr:hypothetical protein [uncultured Kordia sp.]